MPQPAPGTPALSAIRIRHNSGTDVTMHTHATGQLLLVEQGTLMIACDSGWWLAPPGLAVWIPPRFPHQASYSESSCLLRLMLDAMALDPLPGRCLVFTASDLLLALVREVCCFGDEGRDSGDEGLIAALIVHHLNLPSALPIYFLPGGVSRRLHVVTERLKRNPACRDTLEQLASLAHCSGRTLARLFESETGMSFTRWREQLHLTCALDRLARGYSVTRTALELGYLSSSSFSTMFSRVAGVPPSRFTQVGKDSARLFQLPRGA